MVYEWYIVRAGLWFRKAETAACREAFSAARPQLDEERLLVSAGSTNSVVKAIGNANIIRRIRVEGLPVTA